MVIQLISLIAFEHVSLPKSSIWEELILRNLVNTSISCIIYAINYGLLLGAAIEIVGAEDAFYCSLFQMTDRACRGKMTETRGQKEKMN